MKWTSQKRTRILAAVGALIGIASLWWMPAKVEPALAFVGFRKEDGQRVAVFVFQNRFQTAIKYAISPAGDPLVYYRSRQSEGWHTRSPTLGKWSLLDAEKKIEFTTVPKAFGGSQNVPPFQVGIRIVEPPVSASLPSFIPLRRLPETWAIPHIPTIWSQTVTP